MPEVRAVLLMFGALCLGAASVIGGATGFGTSLISTPLMLLAGLSVPQVVIVNLVAGLVTRVGVVYRLREHITWRRVALLAAGSVPGALLGVLTVALVPVLYLKPAAGVLVTLCGVWLALPGRRETRPPSTAAQTVAGVLGGYLSTTTSLNGPPPALLLARARLPAPAFVADLAGYFVVSNALSLLILSLGTPVPEGTLWPMLPVFVSAALAGTAAGLWIGRRLPARAFRGAVIALVVAAGVVTVATS